MTGSQLGLVGEGSPDSRGCTGATFDDQGRCGWRKP